MAHFGAVAGRRLGDGISVVPFDDRTSSTAVVYALGDAALVACSSSLATHLAPLDGHRADEVLDALADLGGRPVDAGLNLIWADAGVAPQTTSPDDRVTWIDVADPADLALVDQLVEACSEDDVEAADIDLDSPDPHIVVSMTEDGTVSSYASGRPFWAFADCDDIGVLVHPEHRRRGLGRSIVSEFVRRRRSARVLLYRHGDDNPGSAAIARGVGFSPVHEVHAVSFEEAQLGE
ncbi:MAG: GNAT family N-acetyltransferase [Actinomycetota bacterium]